MKNRDRESPNPYAILENTCPECGGRILIDDRRHRGEAVRTAVCRSEDCDHFRWEILDGSPAGELSCWDVAEWAIREPLRVLHDGNSGGCFSPLRGVFEEVSSLGR